MLNVKLDGKVCLVSGAGRGIGKAIAESLAASGAHVICVSRSENSCGAVAQSLIADGFSAEHFALDVSKSDEVSAVCEKICEKHGAVDILINNAGITRDNLMLRMTDEQWDEVLQTNLSSCFYFTKCLLHKMMKKRWGRIINISSVVGIIGNFGQANYAAAKAGILGFTKSVARESATRGITVNAIAPGFIKSDMTDSLGENIVAGLLETIPMKSIGDPKDVAWTVEFLCSDAARYITGQVLSVDGGMCM